MRQHSQPLIYPSTALSLFFDNCGCVFLTAPHGVERFLTLVQEGFFTDMLLYRVIPNFLIQFGMAADPGKYKQ